MARTAMILAFGLLAASPVSATVQDMKWAGAPEGTSQTKYCMRIEAVTGTRLEKVKCWTRAEWAERGVDVDVDWAREGVSTIG